MTLQLLLGSLLWQELTQGPLTLPFSNSLVLGKDPSSQPKFQHLVVVPALLLGLMENKSRAFSLWSRLKAVILSNCKSSLFLFLRKGYTVIERTPDFHISVGVGSQLCYQLCPLLPQGMSTL